MYKITDLEIKWCDALTRRTVGLWGRGPTDDEIQIGRLAMVDAAHKYDPEKNDVFWGYAKSRVRGKLLRELNGECYKNDVYNPFKNFNRLGSDFTVFKWPDQSYDHWPSEGFGVTYEVKGEYTR